MKVTALSNKRPETEVTEKTSRRRFSAQYKLRILAEAEACTERGELGALLRREGLYSSLLSKWREQAERGKLAGLTPKKRGPQAKVVDARDRLIAEQERSIRKLTRRIERAEALIEIQKKVAELLGIALPKPEHEQEQES
jgi:transposase